MMKENINQPDRKPKRQAGKNKPSLYSVEKNGDGFKFSRRNFFGALTGTAAALSANAKTGTDKIRFTGSDNKFRAHSDYVNFAYFSPDGKSLISGGNDGLVKLWAVNDGRIIRIFKDHTDDVRSAAFSPDGKYFATCCDDNFIRIYSVSTLDQVIKLKEPDNSIRHLLFSPDGKTIFSCGDDKLIRTYSIPAGQLIKTLPGHTDTINFIAVNQYGNVLGSVSDDLTVRLWQIPEGNTLNTFTNKAAGKCIAISPDNDLIAVGCSDSSIKLYSYSQGKQLKTVSINTGVIKSVAFSPDGKTLASISDDTTVILWSLPGLKTIKRLDYHSKSVSCVAFSPDGKLLVTASSDQTIRLYLMPECQTVWCLFDPDNVNSGTDAVTYKEMGSGIITVPCGTPIPPGATCICDCVAASSNYHGTETVCICNTITVAAGSPLPPGAVCVCNTVSVGNYVPTGHTRNYDAGVCSCNTICTCDTVCTCQGVGSHYWYPC